MYSGPRHTDVGEAMAHNRRVGQAREAEHLRRCSLSPAYKRVYDRWQQTMSFMQKQQSQLANTIQESMNVQRVSDTMNSIHSQTVRVDRPEPLPPQENLEKAALFSNPFSALIFAGMFLTDEQWRQIPENVKAMQEMQEVNEKYDRQIIRMSGFEW